MRFLKAFRSCRISMLSFTAVALSSHMQNSFGAGSSLHVSLWNSLTGVLPRVREVELTAPKRQIMSNSGLPLELQVYLAFFSGAPVWQM